MSAEEALTTKSFYIHRNTVARLYRRYSGSNLLYDTYHLMSNRYAGNSPRHTTVLDMQVTRTYTAERHADNGILRIL